MSAVLPSTSITRQGNTEANEPFQVPLLSVYELGPSLPIPVPRYDGPADWQTDTVLNLLTRSRYREVGTEGRLGGQARVTNIGGTWKDLTNNVNVIANNVSPNVLMEVYAETSGGS